MSTTTRIDLMVESWQADGRAFSSITRGDDSEFFTRIGIDSGSVGITSQTGFDLLYYNTDIFESDNNAIKNIRK